MGLRVFLVDDLFNMHRLVEELFSIIGNLDLVATALSEGEAKLWMEDHPHGWELAIIDLVLESGSGMGVIARCKELHPTCKVCVFSSYVTPVLAEHCIGLGADVVFAKSESLAFVNWLHAELDAHRSP